MELNILWVCENLQVHSMEGASIEERGVTISTMVE